MPAAVPVTGRRTQHERVPKTSVLLVGTQRALTHSLAERLASERDLEVVGIAASLAEARSSVEWLRTDVVVLDADLGHQPAQELAEIGSLSNTVPIVLLAGAERDADVTSLVLAGVSGWVEKADGVPQLLAAIRGVAAGEAWIPPRLLGRLMRSFRASSLGRGAGTTGLAELTDREREVLARMAAGRNRAQIARELVLSESTVRTHAQNILRKLGVHSSLAAVALARRAGMTAAEGDRRATVSPTGGTA